MAFFGLTKLGSQSPFEQAKETPVYVFEADDWRDAFMQTFRPGFTLYSESEEEAAAAQQLLHEATITYDQLPTMLQYLYKCPKGVDNVPDSARQLVAEAFAGQQGRSIGLADFLRIAEWLCKRAEAEDSKITQHSYLKGGLATREFVSGLDFRATMVKHTRMEKKPKDKALAPLTDTQNYGWLKPTIITERHPTKSCEETKYASAMVKAGVYYY